MKLVYISGAYRAPTLYGVVRNIRRAERTALKYWKKGYAVICPHKNTALMDGGCCDKVWLDGDLEMVRRCDMIVMMRNWRKSEGARNEHALAKRLGIRIVYE